MGEMLRNVCVRVWKTSIAVCTHSEMPLSVKVQPWPYSPWVCERGRGLGDDRSRLGGGQSLLGGQAAARAQHGAMRLGMLQRMGLGMVQRWLGMWVLELKLGFELVHTGRSIMRKHLWGGARATISCDHWGTTCRGVSAFSPQWWNVN